jgi:hypothetical protein
MRQILPASKLAVVVATIGPLWICCAAHAVSFTLHSNYSFSPGAEMTDTGPAGNDLVILAPDATTQPLFNALGISNPPGWGFDPELPDEAVRQNDCNIGGCTNGDNAILSTEGGGLGLDPSKGVKYELSFGANPGIGVNGNLNNPSFSPSILLRAMGEGGAAEGAADDQIGLANKMFNGVPQEAAELSFSMYNPGLGVEASVTIVQDPAGITWSQANSGFNRVRAGYDPDANVLFLSVSTRHGTDFVSEVLQEATSDPLPEGWAEGLLDPDQLLIGGERTDGLGNRVVGANLDEYQIFQGVPGPAGQIGDYNEDDVVDAADYVFWRKNNGTSNPLPNRDPEVTGPIGQEDYNAWRENFGNPPGAGSFAQNVGVPEPSTTWLLILGGCCVVKRRRSP